MLEDYRFGILVSAPIQSDGTMMFTTGITLQWGPYLRVIGITILGIGLFFNVHKVRIMPDGKKYIQTDL